MILENGAGTEVNAVRCLQTAYEGSSNRSVTRCRFDRVLHKNGQAFPLPRVNNTGPLAYSNSEQATQQHQRNIIPSLRQCDCKSRMPIFRLLTGRVIRLTMIEDELCALCEGGDNS